MRTALSDTRPDRTYEPRDASWLDHPPGPAREEALVLEGIRQGTAPQYLHAYAGMTVEELVAVTRRLVAQGRIAPGSRYAQVMVGMARAKADARARARASRDARRMAIVEPATRQDGPWALADVVCDGEAT